MIAKRHGARRILIIGRNNDAPSLHWQGGGGYDRLQFIGITVRAWIVSFWLLRLWIIATRKSHGRCAHGKLDAITIVVVAVAVRMLESTVNALVDRILDRGKGTIWNPFWFSQRHCLHVICKAWEFTEVRWVVALTLLRDLQSSHLLQLLDLLELHLGLIWTSTLTEWPCYAVRCALAFFNDIIETLKLLNASIVALLIAFVENLCKL